MNKPLTDATGSRRITVGDKVRQASPQGTPWVDENAGALWCNAGQTGTVLRLGRTRVRVDFGRTRRDRFGTVESTERVVDVVHARMLTVVPDGE